jgi:hypothetical protein
VGGGPPLSNRDADEKYFFRKIFCAILKQNTIMLGERKNIWSLKWEIAGQQCLLLATRLHSNIKKLV